MARIFFIIVFALFAVFGGGCGVILLRNFARAIQENSDHLVVAVTIYGAPGIALIALPVFVIVKLLTKQDR